MNSIGEKIKEIRNLKGIKSGFLAEKLNIHASTLNKYEAGDRKIKADMLPAIADALGVNVSIFFENQVDKSSTKKEVI